jgi:hypothetical protein
VAYTNTAAGGYAGLQARVDSDNKTWLQAVTNGFTATAASIFVLRASTSGLVATGVFSTGYSSVTAAVSPNYFIGIPDETIASNRSGWFQTAGERLAARTATTTGTAGNNFRWASATVQGRAAGSVDTAGVADFAICLTTAAATTSHDMLLLGRRVCGISLP